MSCLLSYVFHRFISTIDNKSLINGSNHSIILLVLVMLLRGETGYNTTALIELVQVQGAHGKTARPLRLMGNLKRLHHISPLSRKQTFLISKQSKVQSL